VLPPYTVEPPDMLMIDAVHIVPRSPYPLRVQDVLAIQMRRAPSDRLQTGDVLAIQAPGALTEAPIEGPYPVQPGGIIDFGPPYGSVNVDGMLVDEAKKAIEQHLSKFLTEPTASVSIAQMAMPIDGTYPVQMGGIVDLGLPYGSVRVAGMMVEEAEQAITEHLGKFFVEPTVSVTLAEPAAKQLIQGEHIVGPDGTVTLGTYGSVSVVGMTLAQAKEAIEQHLSQFLEEPEVAVDVFAYNSKVYWVITQGAGTGDRVMEFPITGNDTVLSAVARIGGMESISSKRIWVARPTPVPGNAQVLPVSWEAITAQGSPTTNYQLLPGDRVFIAEDQLIAFDTGLAKLTAPLERIMGFALLGVGTTTRFSGKVLEGGGNRRGGGGIGF
jgi:polysaccharide export outer membrane protein